MATNQYEQGTLPPGTIDPKDPFSGGGEWTSSGGTWQYNPNTGQLEYVPAGDPNHSGGGGSQGPGGSGSDTGAPPPAGAPPAGAAGGAGATGAGAGSGLLGGMSSGTLGAILQFILGAYGATRPRSFHTAPQSPEIQALEAYLFDQLKNNPQRQVFGTALADYIKADQGTSWTPPPAKYGYNPYPNGVPQYDFSNLIGPIMSSLPGAGTPPAQTGTPSGGMGGGGKPGGVGGVIPQPDHTNSTPAGSNMSAMGAQSPWPAPTPPAQTPPQQPGANMGSPSPLMPPPGQTQPVTSAGAQQPQISSNDANAFRSFVGSKGRHAGEYVASVLEAYPDLGVQGAMNMWSSQNGA